MPQLTGGWQLSSSLRPKASALASPGADAFVTCHIKPHLDLIFNARSKVLRHLRLRLRLSIVLVGLVSVLNPTLSILVSALHSASHLPFHEADVPWTW